MDNRRFFYEISQVAATIVNELKIMKQKNSLKLFGIWQMRVQRTEYISNKDAHIHAWKLMKHM